MNYPTYTLKWTVFQEKYSQPLKARTYTEAIAKAKGYARLLGITNYSLLLSNKLIMHKTGVTYL